MCSPRCAQILAIITLVLAFLACGVSFLAPYWLVHRPMNIRMTETSASQRISYEGLSWDKKVELAKHASPSACGPRILANSSTSLPITALASYPGSGNTWTRMLIETLTGYLTGSVYIGDRIRSDFPAEGIIDGRVVVVKTHNKPYMVRNPPTLQQMTDRVKQGKVGQVLAEKAVVILRSPFDMFMSEYNRLSTGNQTRFAPEARFRTRGFASFVEKQTIGWEKWSKRWIGFRRPKIIIFYEDMVNDLRKELKKMCTFLQMEHVCTDERLECVLKNSRGNYKRDKSKHKNFDPYTTEMETSLNNVIRSVKDTLKTQLGLDAPWIEK